MTDHREPDCPRNDEAVAWALHALEPDEEVQFLRHLPDCDSCRLAVHDAEEVLAVLGTSVEQVDPPPTLRDSLLSRAAETPQQQVPAPAPAEPEPAAAPAAPRRTAPAPAPAPERPSRRGRRLLVAATALVAVLAVGGLAVRAAQLQQERDAETSQAQSISELLDEIARPGTPHALLSTADGATVAAVLVADGRREVYTMGMPPNAADRNTYVLWGVPAGGTPQPLGTFDVTEADTGPLTVGSGDEPDGFTAYAISLEPGRAAPPAPSAVMAQGQVQT